MTLSPYQMEKIEARARLESEVQRCLHYLTIADIRRAVEDAIRKWARNLVATKGDPNDPNPRS